MSVPPTTPNEVALQLARLSRSLDETVQALESADLEATQKRSAFDLAFSHAFVRSEGSVDTRKHLAVIETHRLRCDADVADAVVRHLRRKVDAIKTRIDVGRSMGAAIRAELTLGNAGYEP